jgi:hypothetical protein
LSGSTFAKTQATSRRQRRIERRLRFRVRLEPRADSCSGDACVAVGAADVERSDSMLRIDATQASPLHQKVMP